MIVLFCRKQFSNNFTIIGNRLNLFIKTDLEDFNIVAIKSGMEQILINLNKLKDKKICA